MGNGTARLVEATPSDFDSQVFGDFNELAIVYFWGPNCPNCEIFARHLPLLMESLQNWPIKLVKTNAYEFPDLGTQFGIFGIPTFILVHQRKVLGRMSSFQGDEFFLTVIREALDRLHLVQ